MQQAKSFKQFFGFLLLTRGLGGLLGATAVHAAECKGMSKSKCESAAACTWVKSYKTSKGKTVDVEKFKLKIEEAKPAAAGDREVTGFTGTLDWVEPFVTQAQQRLNLEILSWRHGVQPVLFVAVSPQPGDHAIWTELRRLQKTFRFED